MIQRLTCMLAGVVALVLAVGVSPAQAQTTPTCPYNMPDQCQVVGPGTTQTPGPERYTPDNPASAFETDGGPSPDVIPATPTPVPADATTDTQAPQLAFTGAETNVLTLVGAGLIAAGTLSLAARRRLNDSRDD
ncbi:MAG: LPXTG cell wall anchor domain-containing protein [Actinomycetota bacterium]